MIGREDAERGGGRGQESWQDLREEAASESSSTED